MQENQQFRIAGARGAPRRGGIDLCKKVGLLAVMLTVLASCSSVSQVGLMVAPKADPGSIITEARTYSEIGPVEGTACRFFILAIIPVGNSTTGLAMEKALGKSGGDAVINATVKSGLYGFIPIYNVLSFTCTTVSGIAIKFDKPG